MKLSDAQVLVTGGGRGIGRHLVERMLTDARAVAVFEKEEAIHSLKAALPAAKCYACDVTDPALVTNAIAQLEADGFLADVLVNNAGLISSAPLINMLSKDNRVHSATEWQRVLNANLSSVFYVTGRVADQMLRRRIKGVVISLSSICAGMPDSLPTLRPRLESTTLTRTWAKELGALNSFCGGRPRF